MAVCVMRWISLPYELALPHLLDLHDSPPALRDLLTQAAQQLESSAYDVALEKAREAYALAKARLDRYSQSLALLFRAEAFRRLLHWEDSLESIRGALHWLELSVSPAGQYNEAVAAYLEGVVHWTLRADDKVVQTFAYAQQILVESERYWGYERNEARTGDCRNLTRWMSQVLEVRKSLPLGDATVVVPVYEFVNHTRIRTGAFVIQPFRAMIPGDGAARCLPADYHPVNLEACFTPMLSPQSTYVAVLIAQAGQWLWEGRAGDLLVVEVTGASLHRGELMLVSDEPFLRRTDGRIEFGSALAPGNPQVFPSERGIVGIPRFLVRGGGEL